MSEVKQALTLEPAEDGGFVVVTARGQDIGLASALRFAGSLDDCLDYLREQFEPMLQV